MYEFLNCSEQRLGSLFAGLLSETGFLVYTREVTLGELSTMSCKAMINNVRWCKVVENRIQALRESKKNVFADTEIPVAYVLREIVRSIRVPVQLINWLVKKNKFY